MTAFERRWTAAVLEAFAPPGGPGLAPRPGEVDYVATFATLMRRTRPAAAWGLRLAIWLAALAPFWLRGRLHTVTGLTHEARARLLDELLRHRSFPVRELTLLLKVSAAMALLGTPSVRARSGYDHVQAANEIESGLHPRSGGAIAPVRLAVIVGGAGARRNGDGKRGAS